VRGKRALKTLLAEIHAEEKADRKALDADAEDRRLPAEAACRNEELLAVKNAATNQVTAPLRRCGRLSRPRTARQQH
jgi:hypothetical protein